MISSDFHMHTDFSTDSDTPAREMIEEAIKKNLDTICVTDHYDMDYPFYEDMGAEAFSLDVDEYLKTLHVLKDEYADRIDIRVGIEIGLQPHLGEHYKKVMQKFAFDFVIGSVHVINGKDPYYQEMLLEGTDEELYREAFLETLKNLENVNDFDVLGHIDYVVRYGKHQARDYSYSKYADLLDKILNRVIFMGKGIEINTSGFKYGLDFSHPHPDVIKRYRELGGEVITIGADGHKPEHIAYDFYKVSEILKSCGFKYYTEFKARKPIFKQLP